jgi:undecaprenyl-diphosphatase
MPVFPWEQHIIELAKTWPQQGPLFQFMYSISDFSLAKYFIIAGLVIVTWKFGYKLIVPKVLFCLMAVLLSEIVSRRIIKALVMRPRPNYLGLECHASACWGFVSSHATNLFSVAVFLCLYDRRNALWTIPIAVMVSFSRIYLMDHFPLDVIGGAVVGAAIGLATWRIFCQSRFYQLGR